MTRDRWLGLSVAAVGLVLVAGLAGCSNDPRPSASGSPGPQITPTATPSAGSTAPSPTQPPASAQPSESADPQQPTDTSNAGWISGILNADPRGDCYTLTTDDGDLYAIYHSKGGPLRRGERVRAHIGPPTVRIVCGEGRQVAADQLIAVR
jgi:hypothetical protein